MVRRNILQLVTCNIHWHREENSKSSSMTFSCLLSIMVGGTLQDKQTEKPPQFLLLMSL